MDIEVASEGAKVLFAIEGKLTAQTSGELEAAIAKVDPSVRDFDFDLSNVSYIASAGLRVLVMASKLTDKRGGTMRLIHPVDEVMDILEMTGLTEVFSIER